jgi:hypothetical protein
VTSPNGGEIWKEGETRQITWSVAGLTAADNVTIQFTTDGGVSWRPDVATTVPAVPGTFNWTIPAGSATASGQVRVVYASDISVNDRSDGLFTILPAGTNSVPDVAVTGSGLQLFGNYPNPFATSTTLRWRQGASGDVTLRLYDGNGREVETYELGQREAGAQQMTLQSRELPSGLYFYLLQIGTTAARGTVMIAR